MAYKAARRLSLNLSEFEKMKPGIIADTRLQYVETGRNVRHINIRPTKRI